MTLLKDLGAELMVVNMVRVNRIVRLMFVAALALLVVACSPSAAKLTAVGNQAFTKQDYEGALKAYAEAQANSPELAEPVYNSANVLYREGKYEEALKVLQQAAQVAQTGPVAQGSHFNAGNAAFNTQGWDTAVESYRQALLRDPADLDAKHNLELALQQMQQQQDQQNQDQQQDQQQDEQNQDQQDPQKQDPQQNDQGQQDQQNQDQQQGQQQDGQGQQDQQNQDQQQGQRNQPQVGQGQDQRDQQAEGGSQADKQQDGDPRPGSQLAPGQRMTQDQARQLLAAIAGKSDTLQGRLGQFLRVRARPPVQDW
jgi:Ca-activated chloride channel family protein